MSVTVCWAAKGGSGTTLIAATLALTCRTDSLLVDLDGQLPMMLGIPAPPGQGATDWLASDAAPAALGRLTLDVDRSTRLLPVGTSPGEHHDDRWLQLVAWLTTQGTTVVDAGTRVPPLALVADDAVRTLLITRNCYVNVSRALATGCRPDGVVLVIEPGRSLRPRDVSHALGAPVVATVDVDPAVGRIVDAGLLTTRMPRGLVHDLRGAA